MTRLGLRGAPQTQTYFRFHGVPWWLISTCLHSCTSLCRVSARLQNATLPVTAPGEVYTVCAAPNNPFVNCTVGLYPSDASGYEVEVFKRVALQIGLRPEQYTFVCRPYSAMINDMTDPSGECDIAAAGYTFFSSRLMSGTKFVYPGDYRTGQIVMVHADIKEGGQWLFLKPFKWEVWLFLLCAAIAVGVSVHCVEILAKRHMSREIHNRFRFNGAGGFFDSMWAAIAQVADAGDPVAGVSFPARLIIFVWCFLILLLLTIYTGNAAAILTTTSINTDITSASDLRGRNWGTYVASQEILKQQGLVPSRTYRLDNTAEQQAMIDSLRKDEVEALVVECGLATFMTSFICDIHTVGECFAPQDQGLALWQNASDASVALAGLAVAQLEEAGDLDRLRDSFISPGSSCNSQVNSGTRPVTFSQVSGLWIVLGASIGVAFFLALILKHMHKRKYIAELRRKAFMRRSFSKRKRSRSGDASAAVDAVTAATCPATTGEKELEAGELGPVPDAESPVGSSPGEKHRVRFDEVIQSDGKV